MKNKTSLTIIFITIFIDLMGFGILIPILPTFASKQVGATDFEIGVTVAVFSFMQFIFNPILGRLSDRIGRRPVILSTQLMTIISYLIFAFTNSFLLLVLSRLIAGIGGSNIGVAQAYIADITTKEERAKGMGLIGAAFGLGFVFGPLIGAFLSKYGYSVIGFSAAGFSFIAFLFALLKLPESLIEKKVDSKFSYKIFDFNFTKKVISSPSVGILIILFFIIIFSVANIYGTLALLTFKVYHFNDQQNGILFGLTGLIGAFVQAFLMKKISQKFSDKKIVVAGLIFMVIGLGFIPYGGNFLGLAIVISILAIGTGILQPIIPSMISKRADQNLQGSILGVNQSISALARVFGPLWGGFSFDFFGYQFPFLTGAFFTFITIFLAIYLIEN
ncbi:MAG: MFS transporter [Melioribacteraceae bacterium]|nr:MFS transporter [Melioribacteraceae bacterium]